MKKFVIFSFFIISNLISTTKIMAGCVSCPTVKVCKDRNMNNDCRNLKVGEEYSSSSRDALYIKGRLISKYYEESLSGDENYANIIYKGCDSIGNMYLTVHITIFGILSYIPKTEVVILDRNGNILYSFY